MIELIWAISCEKILTDTVTNQVSYIQAIEELTIKKAPPATLPQITIGTLWEKTDGGSMEFKLRLSFLNPKSEKIDTMITEKISGSNRHRLNVIGVGGFKITEPGKHIILFEISEKDEEWKEAGRLPLNIVFKEEKNNKKQSREQ